MNPAIIGGLIGGAASLLGGERRNSAQAEQAEQANAFSAQQFATRYQTTVKDMAAAGLNPMLAYSQGGGSPPSGQQAQMQDTATPAVESFNRARQVGIQEKLNSAQVANIDADTENKKAQAGLIVAQTAQATASAGQAGAQTKVLEETVHKTRQEVENLKTDQERVKSVIDNLRIEYGNLIKQGYNLTEVGNQLRATVAKMEAEIPYIRNQTFKSEMEGRLAELDKLAAEKFDNFGREARELRPVLDVLKHVFRFKAR